MTGAKLHSVKLTDDEVLALEHIERPDVQAAIRDVLDRRKLADSHPDLTDAQRRFVADLRAEATAKGRLVFRSTWLHYGCKYSGERPVLALTRSRRPYKDRRQIPVQGIEFAERFVTVEGVGVVACSRSFFENIKPRLAELLADVHAEIPAQITGHPPKWRRHDNVECSECGWSGHEGQMGREPTLLGDGTYPGRCPSCSAVNRAFSSPIVKRTDGFSLVEVDP